MMTSVESTVPDSGIEFESFYRAVEPRIRRALVAACGPNVGIEAAAAAMQYGFEHWNTVRILDNPAGYLYRVARNAARSRRKPLPAIERDVAERYGFEPGLPRALNRLTEKQRQAVLMVHAGGFSLAEAADTLGVSVSTLRNHLARGLDRLRRHLGVTS